MKKNRLIIIQVTLLVVIGSVIAITLNTDTNVEGAKIAISNSQEVTSHKSANSDEKNKLIEMDEEVKPFIKYSLEKDFPNESKAVNFEFISQLPITTDQVLRFIVVDSTLFPIQSPNTSLDEFGCACNIYTGEKGAKIITRGKTKKEVISPFFLNFYYDKGRILLQDMDDMIVSINPNDIINNVPMGDRDVKKIKDNSKSIMNDKKSFDSSSIWCALIMDNDVIFGGLNNYIYPPYDYKESNYRYRYCVYDGNNVYKFGKFTDKVFFEKGELKKMKSSTTTFQCPTTQADYKLSSNKNKVAVSMFHHLTLFLEVVDVDKKAVTQSRSYGLMRHGSGGNKYFGKNLFTDDTHIYAIAEERFKDKDGKKCSKQFLLIYDWKLKPVKKIALEDDMCQVGTRNYVVASKDKVIYKFEKEMKGDQVIWRSYKSNFEI